MQHSYKTSETRKWHTGQEDGIHRGLFLEESVPEYRTIKEMTFQLDGAAQWQLENQIYLFNI